MDLSILILNYNTRAALQECLASVYRHPPGLDFEVIVVDNASVDDSVAMVQREFPQVRLLQLSLNGGYPRGNNAGLRIARGEAIALMNPDIVVLESGLERLHLVLTDDRRTGMAGPCLVYPDGRFQNSAYRAHRVVTPIYRRTPLGLTPWGQRELSRFLMSDWDFDSDADVEWLMSSCVMVRREAIEAVGLFDERFFLYFADADLCRRLWRAGWSVRYTPSATFVHHHYRGSAKSLRLATVHVIDFVRYAWKWRGVGSPRVGQV